MLAALQVATTPDWIVAFREFGTGLFLLGIGLICIPIFFLAMGLVTSLTVEYIEKRRAK
jgi:hypothetical protein